MEKKDLDLEATEPLLNAPAIKPLERKAMSKVSATRTEARKDLSLKFKKIFFCQHFCTKLKQKTFLIAQNEV